MRLEFNMVLVDDEWDDDDHRGNIEELISKLNTVVIDKGFQPTMLVVTDPSEIDIRFDSGNGRRIDLYISDNNLGMVDTGEATDDGGIKFYLELKEKSVCDFVLYTRADEQSIVDRLVEQLTEKKDPNIFSRFTFVSRHARGAGWHQPIIKVIEHMLTKREEINNLRGLYAQITARMDSHLRTLVKVDTSQLNFEGIINQAAQEGVFKGNTKLKDWLHNQRQIRNGLMHNDPCRQK